MLKLDAAFAADIDVAVVESSSMVAFSSSDLWNLHYRNLYGILCCDFVVVVVVVVVVVATTLLSLLLLGSWRL